MRGQLRKQVRPYLELIGAALTLLVTLWQAPWIVARFSEPTTPWSAAGLYSGIFSWTSIQTGFLFAIYTFIVPRSEPFVKAVSATHAFRNFKGYMLRTVYLTLVVAIVALALMVWNPVPSARGWLSTLLSFWISLSVYSVLCFLKCIRTFRKLDRAA